MCETQYTKPRKLGYHMDGGHFPKFKDAIGDLAFIAGARLELVTHLAKRAKSERPIWERPIYPTDAGAAYEALLRLPYDSPYRPNAVYYSDLRLRRLAVPFVEILSI